MWESVLYRRSSDTITMRDFNIWEEISKNNYSIAVPVRDANGKVACAITVVGPLSRVNKGKLEQFIRIMKDAAQDASERLGYDGE